MLRSGDPEEETPDSPKSPVRWDEALKSVKITALSKAKDGRYIAIVKDIGVVEAGSQISVNYEDLTYRWRVKSISSKGIVPERLGASARNTNRNGRSGQ